MAPFGLFYSTIKHKQNFKNYNKPFLITKTVNTHCVSEKKHVAAFSTVTGNNWLMTVIFGTLIT